MVRAIMRLLPSPILFLILFAIPLSAQWRKTAPLYGTSNAEYVWCLAQTAVFLNGIEVYYQYAGTNDGVFISNNYGDSWTKFNVGLESFDRNILSIVPRGVVIYAAGYGGVFKSETLGSQWTSIARYENGFTMPSVTALEVNDPYIYGATMTAGVFQSSNGGTSWKQINSGLPSTSLLQINKLYRPPSGNPPAIYAATGFGVYVCPNNGTTWYSANQGIPSLTEIYSLTSLGNVMLAGTLYGTYRSTNMGANWVKAVGMSTSAVYSFAVYGQNIFAGTSIGIYLSTDSGLSWRNVSTGSDLEYATIYSLAVMRGYLVAGTYQKGVWRRPLSEMVGVVKTGSPLPEKFSLEQNYPNPFNPETTIRYSLAARSKIKIKIYNFAGQEIETAVDETLGKGSYSLTWNAKGYASGVYFYKAEIVPADGSRSTVLTKKMVLIK